MKLKPPLKLNGGNWFQFNSNNLVPITHFPPFSEAKGGKRK